MLEAQQPFHQNFTILFLVNMLYYLHQNQIWDMSVNDVLSSQNELANPALKACEAENVYNSLYIYIMLLYSGDSYRTKVR